MRNCLYFLLFIMLSGCPTEEFDLSFRVYRPEIIDDEFSPIAISDLSEMANNPYLNLHQRVSFEQFFFRAAVKKSGNINQENAFLDVNP